MGLASIVPFLKNLIQPPPAAAPTDPSDGGSQVVDFDHNQNPSKLPNAATMPAFLTRMQNPAGPPVPPAPAPDPQPNMSADPIKPQAAAAASAPTANPLDDLAATPVDAEGKPKLAPETKGHALLRILTSSVRGALDGAAANAQTYAQTGRNAGFGGGFEGAEMQPYQKALMATNLAQERAKTSLITNQANQMGQSVMIMTPNGPMYVPAFLAKGALGSSISGQYRQGAAETEAQAKTDSAKIGAQGRVDAAKASYGPLADVPQDLQDQFGLPAKLPLKFLNTAESAANKPLTVVAGANDSYTVNKQTGQKTALGVGNRGAGAAMFKPVQVVDPDNPGNTKWMTAGQAISSGMAGTDSASLSVPKNVLQWATTGKGGEEVNAFNTALQHADLLEKAVVAMHNGDQKTLNSLKNSFKTEFGSSDVTNFNVIANAYTREISKMLSSGHMTNDEINTNGATLPSNASDDQLYGAINGYRALANSKMLMRYNQFQQGMKGKPNFPANADQTSDSKPQANKFSFVPLVTAKQ